MPLHIGSFVEEKKSKKILAEILTLCSKTQNPISPDGIHFHTEYPLVEKNGKKIGKIVFTFDIADGHLNLIDGDIVGLPEKPTKLYFEHKLTKAGMTNEYYNVITEQNGFNFQIETVNRFFIKNKIEGTSQDVYLSAFPFVVEIYDDIYSFNKAHEFGVVKLKNGKTIHGFSKDYMCPNMHESNDNNPHSFILATVNEIEDIELKINMVTIKFKIIRLKTGAGIIPTFVSEKVFDLRELEEGKLLAVSANIKADFKTNPL